MEHNKIIHSVLRKTLFNAASEICAHFTLVSLKNKIYLTTAHECAHVSAYIHMNFMSSCMVLACKYHFMTLRNVMRCLYTGRRQGRCRQLGSTGRCFAKCDNASCLSRLKGGGSSRLEVFLSPTDHHLGPGQLVVQCGGGWLGGGTGIPKCGVLEG